MSDMGPDVTSSAAQRAPMREQHKRGVLNLAQLAQSLEHRLSGRLPPSLMSGKTCLRDEVMITLSCSAVEAEEIVDALVGRGLVRFERLGEKLGDPRYGHWQFPISGGRTTIS